MSASTLVAYATRCGSTAEVAEAIGKTLTEAGHDVDVRRLPVAGDIDGYSGVVLGAPLYMFRWHRDALRFLKSYRKALEDRPVALFALGPFNNVEKEWLDARAQLDKELVKFKWFKPVAVKIVGGKFDPELLGLPYSLVPAMKKIPPCDIRDWAAVREWAQEAACKFSST
jgi:menaquinone-dependent protoporphyrinogen oxidase